MFDGKLMHSIMKVTVVWQRIKIRRGGFSPLMYGMLITGLFGGSFLWVLQLPPPTLRLLYFQEFKNILIHLIRKNEGTPVHVVVLSLTN